MYMSVDNALPGANHVTMSVEYTSVITSQLVIAFMFPAPVIIALLVFDQLFNYD